MIPPACKRVILVVVGGTFVDLVAVGADQAIVPAVPSTPHSPNIETYAAPGVDAIAATTVTDLVGSLTMATNVILERKYGIVALSVGGGGGYGLPPAAIPWPANTTARKVM